MVLAFFSFHSQWEMYIQLIFLNFFFGSPSKISVEKVAMKSAEDTEDEITRAVEMADIFLKHQKDTLIMTSRELITGKSEVFLIS